jgi:CRISPR-associated protein Cst2
MTQRMPIYSLSLNARATLDLHSLNNEGGEGNQIQTRMVNIVGQDGQLHNVNAVSGDMYKHIHAEHIFRIASERGDLPLCAGCRTFNANRINADTDFIQRTKGMSDAATLDELLRTCALDDTHGILITEGGRSVPRKSVIEFGWVVGVPDSVKTDSYFHVKYASERSEGRRGEDRESTDRGANLGQAIFHRPASSGIYAAVCHVEMARIGFNDITQLYAIDEQQRAVRARAVLEALLYTFLETRGAMRSAQAPHLVNLEGALTYSTKPVPAPTVSPLNNNYPEHIEQTVGILNRINNGDVVQLRWFNSTAELANVIADLLETTSPFSLRYTTGA